MLKNLYDLEIIKADNYRNLDEATVEKIKSSILAVGLQEPIQLFQVNETGELMVVSGHHRLEAMKRIKAEAAHSSMVFQGEVVRGTLMEYRSQNVAVKSVMANSMRKDMAIVDRAKAYDKLLEAGLDIDTISLMVDKEASTIKKTLLVAKLPIDVLDFIESQPKLRDSIVYKYAAKYDKDRSLDVRSELENLLNQKPVRKGASAGKLKVDKELFSRQLKETGEFDSTQIKTILKCLGR